MALTDGPGALAERRSRAVDVADYVTELIRVRQLLPGDRIATAQELQDQLGVAKSTVAAAVKLLADRGQATAKTGPYGGLFVAAAESGQTLKRYLIALDDAERIDQVMVIRDHLEELVARTALDDATDADLEHVVEIARNMARAPSGDVLGEIWRFHRRLAETLRNRVLKELYLSLTDYLSSSTVPGLDVYADDPEGFLSDRIQIHGEIALALAARDRAALDAALGRHRG